MINWMYFPQNRRIEEHLISVVKVFDEVRDYIDSEVFQGDRNLKSDDVLSFVREGLEDLDFIVEKSKRQNDIIRVPVLFGQNGEETLAFEVDAYSKKTKTVIEVEAGRAVSNYQFLKDFFEACMMLDVRYFCVAVKNIYKSSKDYEKVCKFFESLFISNRLIIPLEGVLVIGY